MNLRVFLLLLSSINLILSCQTENKKKLKKREFTEIYRDSLKKLHPEVTYNIPQDLEIQVKSEYLDFTHYLDNAFTLYKAEPDSLSAILDMYLKSSNDLYKKEEEIQRNKIIPVIKDVGYLEEVAITLSQNKSIKEPIKFVYEKYNNKLIILYGENNENGIAYFSEERLKASGLNKDSLLPIALKNLDAELPKIERKGDEGLYMITAGGNFEASLILQNYMWTKENMPVNGKIVIAIPTRDLLLVTGSNNSDGLKKIKKTAQEAWESGPYQLLPDLFIWNGKKFEPYK
jgi:uncharacterized protein YtpQ (UPF0354 family)